MSVTEADTISFEKQPDVLQAAGFAFSHKVQSGKTKLYEWISNTDLLVFLIIVVILVFLGVCCFIFYNAFYPNGIPDHLKEDYSSEDNNSNRGENMMMMEEEGMTMMMMEADNGNGAAVEM